MTIYLRAVILNGAITAKHLAGPENTARSSLMISAPFALGDVNSPHPRSHGLPSRALGCLKRADQVTCAIFTLPFRSLDEVFGLSLPNVSYAFKGKALENTEEKGIYPFQRDGNYGRCSPNDLWVRSRSHA